MDNTSINTKALQRLGEVAYELFWDSGGPFVGADREYIYEYKSSIGSYSQIKVFRDRLIRLRKH